MGYFSDFYVDSFPQDVFGKFIILLNQIKIHNKQKYLLIVAQDMTTFKIVRLIDYHGKMFDLYKYQEDWAKLKKGDIIKVRCIRHESSNCVNVLRVISNFELVDSLNYYERIKETWELTQDVLNEKVVRGYDKNNMILQTKKTDLEYLGKKLKGRYGFVLFSVYNSKLVEYQSKNNKIKHQFVFNNMFKKVYYADIVSYVKDIDIRIGDTYSGFALVEFKYKNNRLRLKVYDFLNEDDNFKEPDDLKVSNWNDVGYDDFEDLDDLKDSNWSGVGDDDLPF